MASGAIGSYGGLRVELHPDLTDADCYWVNTHLALAEADYCYLPKRPLPPGPGSPARGVWPTDGLRRSINIELERRGDALAARVRTLT